MLNTHAAHATMPIVLARFIVPLSQLACAANSSARASLPRHRRRLPTPRHCRSNGLDGGGAGRDADRRPRSRRRSPDSAGTPGRDYPIARPSDPWSSSPAQLSEFDTPTATASRSSISRRSRRLEPRSASESVQLGTIRTMGLSPRSWTERALKSASKAQAEVGAVDMGPGCRASAKEFECLAAGAGSPLKRRTC